MLKIFGNLKRISQTWKRFCLLSFILWLCFPNSSWIVELIIWNDSFCNTRMNKVDTWCKTNQTSGVIKDCVKVSKEWFSENPGIIFVILEWQEALIFLSYVDDVGFWNKFDIISIVNKERNILIQVDITWTVEETIVITSNIWLVVEESTENLSTDGMWNLYVWVERIKESFFFWEIESRFCTVFKSRLVANSKSVNGDFPLLLIRSIKIDHWNIWYHLGGVISSKNNLWSTKAIKMNSENLLFYYALLEQWAHKWGAWIISIKRIEGFRKSNNSINVFENRLGPIIHQQEWEFSDGLWAVFLKFEIIVSKDTFSFLVIDFDSGLSIINLSNRVWSLIFESTVFPGASLTIWRIN